MLRHNPGSRDLDILKYLKERTPPLIFEAKWGNEMLTFKWRGNPALLFLSLRPMILTPEEDSVSSLKSR